MSAQNKPSTGATANNAKRPESGAFKVLNIVKREIQSELISAKNEHKDGKPQGYRAEFTFAGNLRRYLSLQNQASRERKAFSSLISFTSADAGPDVLALPGNMYVKDTWGEDGTKILRMVDYAMRSTKTPGVTATISHDCYVSITVQEDHLYLVIKRARTSFAKIIEKLCRLVEQICWIVSVSGSKSTTLLENYVKQTNQGASTRKYTETIYTGRPVIKSIGGCHFNISFMSEHIEKGPNRNFVARSGHCWKTMTGLSIIARGFAIPPRPRHGTGLEAPLFVLRQLFKRGCSRTSPLPMDKPMVMFPPSTVKRPDKSGKAIPVYELRLILAADCELPLRARSNVIYWHFDPAKVCASLKTIEQLEDNIRVAPRAIDPESRHFVGWSNSVTLLTTALKPIPLGTFSNLDPRPHFELALTGIAPNVRFPAVLAAGFNIGAEKLEIETPPSSTMSRDGQLQSVSACMFVLWDTNRERGWLLRGDTVALHMLRVSIAKNKATESFDFSSLKILRDVADDDSPAFSVLNKFNNQEDSLNRIMPGFSDSDDEAEKQLKNSLGKRLDHIYSLLLFVSGQAPKLNQHPGLSGPLRTWYDKKWGTTLRGMDFDQLVNLNTSVTHSLYFTRNLHKDPGWLRMANELNAAFLFCKGLGEIFEPRAGSCCPYFPTLPAGNNFLAADMYVLGQLIEKYGGDDVDDPPDHTVARLSSDHGWEHGLDPFSHPNCHGDHLSTLEPSCFPVQGVRHAAPERENEEKRPQREMKLIKEKRLYTKKEARLIISKHPKGVVVFGRQPGPEELKQMYRRSRNKGTQSAKATTVESSKRPSSRSSTQGSIGTAPAPAPAEGSVRPSTASAQRTPSTDSIRRGVSTTQTRGLGITTAPGQPGASTPKSLAASMHKASSNASLRSTGSKTNPKVLQSNVSRAGQPQSSASQSPAALVPRSASNASLRSSESITRSRASNARSIHSHEPSAGNNALAATRKPSNSSVRTASSVASTATGGSQSQKPPAQLSSTGLEKTVTNSSDRTTSSHSSGATQNSMAGPTAAKNRQRQQLLNQAGNAMAANANLALGQVVTFKHGATSAGSTEDLSSTSSAPAPTAGGAPDISS